MLKENENELVIFQFKSLNYCCKPNRKNACILFWLLGFLFTSTKLMLPYVYPSADQAASLHRTRSPRAVRCIPMQLSLWSWLMGSMW